MRSEQRRKVNVLEVECLRSLVGVSRKERVGNDEVRRRTGIERELAGIVGAESIKIVWTDGENGCMSTVWLEGC